MKSLEGVSAICATSQHDLIDLTVLRSERVDRMVMPIRDSESSMTREVAEILEEIVMENFAVMLEKCSGADIKSNFITANMQVIEKHLKSSDHDDNSNNVLITSAHQICIRTMF